MGFELSLDDAFRALANDTRRQMLIRLLGPDPNPKISVPEEIPLGNSTIEDFHSNLHHRHLPLLEDLELILWDVEARTVSRGVKFDAIRPVLELLDEHSTDSAGEQLGRDGLSNT